MTLLRLIRWRCSKRHETNSHIHIAHTNIHRSSVLHLTKHKLDQTWYTLVLILQTIWIIHVSDGALMLSGLEWNTRYSYWGWNGWYRWGFDISNKCFVEDTLENGSVFDGTEFWILNFGDEYFLFEGLTSRKKLKPYKLNVLYRM